MGEGTVEALSKVSVCRWNIAIRTLQTGIKKAQTDDETQRLYSPCFKVAWCIQLEFYTSSANPESNGYCGVFLRMMTELSPPPLVSFSAEFSVATDPEQMITSTQAKVRERLFTRDRPACGWRAVIPLSWLETQDSEDTLQVTLEMTEGTRVEPALVPQGFFDNYQHCDVAFTFANCEEPLLALKAVLMQQSSYCSSLFASEFSESSANYVLDPDARTKRSNWLTFSAFIWWLYYSEVRFVPSRAAVFGTLDLNPDLDIEKNMPQYWEILALDRTGPPYACNPHALYRLADRYLEVRLRDIVKKHILSTLTPATAAYAAFSSLGRTFQDVQDGVVDYILKHTDEVVESPGWERALELIDEGSLSGGAAVLSKILSSRSRMDEAVLGENSSRQTVAA